MMHLRELAARALGLVRRRRDPAADEEIQFHLDMAEQDLLRRGVPVEDAHREARVLFGGVTQVRERLSDQRTLPPIETCLQDVRYGVRVLRRTPALTLAALVTLALGIGANTAMFSVVHAVLLRPLPFPAPDRLVMFGDRTEAGPSTIGFETWRDIRDRATSLEATAAIRPWQPTLVVDAEAEPIEAMRVSWNYFDVLGVRPALGRTFRPEEDRPEQWRVVILSDALWRRRFSADPAVVGRAIRMNDRDYRIIGVLPPDFQPLVSEHYYKPADMWAALGYDTTLSYACRTCRHLRAIARVRDDVPLETSRAEMNGLRDRLVEQFPREYPRGEMAVVALQETLAGPVQGTLLTLLAAVGFVLLIACANVANLLLARSEQRSREMALRAALGAARGRLVRQLITESLLLSLGGGLAGLVVAVYLTAALVDLAPVSIPRLDEAVVDGGVLAFTAGLSIATGLLFGVAPARRAAATNLQHALAGDPRSAAPASRTGRFLVAADVALALLLLVGGRMMVRSVARLTHVDPGFDASGVLTLRYSLIGSAYAEDTAVNAFTERLLDRVRGLPGVLAAAAAGQIPMGGSGDSWGFQIEGRGPDNPADRPSVERYSVTREYFRVMRIPLKAGRLFTPADHAGAQPVVIVSESTARALWRGESPVGARVHFGDPKSPWRTIVGVVGSVRHEALDLPPPMQMYLPEAQFTDSFLVLTLRTAGASPEALTAAVRGILRDMDPAVPLFEVFSLERLVERTTAERRFVMYLLGGFAALALLLAAIGLYGSVAALVAARTREIGVRVALGAGRGDVCRLVLGSGAKAIVGGLVAGTAAALALGRLLESLLFEVRPTDPLALGGAAGLLTVVALLAHWVPLRRALGVDPVIALRQE